MRNKLNRSALVLLLNVWAERKSCASNQQETNELRRIARQMKESIQEIGGGKYVKRDNRDIHLEGGKIMERIL